MRLRRENKLLVEPPSSATGDIAFNLIVFFLVCASVQPDNGRQQNLPKSESKDEKQQQSENIEVAINRTNVVNINGTPYEGTAAAARLQAMISAKTRPEDKIVVLKAAKETSYEWWTTVVVWIEEAGGTITIQREEERTIMAD